MASSAPLRFACRYRERVRGLIGAHPDEGTLVIAPCNDIHTFGMADLLDVAFIGKDGVVLESYRAVAPRRRIRCRKAVAVLERFSVSDGAWYERGDRVQVKGKEGGRA